MLSAILNGLLGTKQERDLKDLLPYLRAINELEPWALSLGDEDFPLQTLKFREELQSGVALSHILPRAFALAREACRRVLGERPYDVQILGSLTLHDGRITEMKTGEGKTLTGVAAAYLNALSGQGVHIVTVNDYLASRDKAQMERVHNFLGLTVGLILPNMENSARREAYACDITYATNNELGFDYLRDNMTWDIKSKCMRAERHFCIIDEIDSILIDEARTPLIISGPDEEEDTSVIQKVNGFISYFEEVEKDPATGQYPLEDPLVKTEHKGDYKLDEKSKRILFTDAGFNKMEHLLQKAGLINGSLFDGQNFEMVHYLTQAMKAHKLFHIDVDYVIADGQVQIVDEFTGRILHGRRYSDGLHQAIEAKENIKVAKRNLTMATITFQNFFRMYKKISGMTGTADTEAREFTKIYKLDVAVMPTNRPVIRTDINDEIYLTQQFKMDAISKEVKERHIVGQPVLIGTVSVERSELLSKVLTKNGVPHEILNAKNHGREAFIIAEAGAKGAVTIATNMAGRGTDIKLGGNPEMRAKKQVDATSDPERYHQIYQRELERTSREYEEVKALGGLYIVGTERHDSRRIDNQLRGRAGRQGDPGYSKFYISLEDDLMRLFGGERLRAFMGRLGMDTGESLQHSLVSRSIERAQKRVEERNYEIRKHLLDYDDVLNRQRKHIYELRDSLLSEEMVARRIIRTASELAEEFLEEFHKNKTSSEGLNAQLLQDLRIQFGFEPEDVEQFISLSKHNQHQKMHDFFEADMLHKANSIEPEVFNKFLRFEYLRNLDRRWQQHLDAMEGLREAVNLRTYAQRNPLVEYKIEGFQLFDAMLDELAKAVVSRVFRVKLQPTLNATPTVQRAAVSTHRSMGNLLGGGDSGSNSAKKNMHRGIPSQQNTPKSVQRHIEKIGRNDPCPCGSGKKYKQCHGK
ncbi:preprotein translocase subunit SecA [Entomospira nematocerorum]|uniref:Protein translocase subunit SecA n=1 Tax=Entomospira nematocerorum TaxID=2719987 RepID=A0A968GDS8_9SPIO|nr:preprotein translocase subunit SecA [Entomospira nematocera]NIZ47409.1 preprotein translocase subunit SecA [Entomospira nematocera]WDI34052.1 preprotein translocase subunit SecA [Entomospira nematocera]